MVLRARKTAVTCKPLFHQGRGYPKAKQPGSILKKSAVCIGFVVIPKVKDHHPVAFVLAGGFTPHA